MRRIRKQKPVELLAPAGDFKKLKYALAYGADAVYLGLPQFSLRAQTGFTMADLKNGIEYAHKLKKKVYVTINIFAHNAHIKKLPPHLQALKKLNPDAVVISDPGVLQLVKKYLPKTSIHLSTQSNTLNYEAVKFWQKFGVKRIILGREATLKDIKEIKKQSPKMELEVFVHGAMCMSYSGRCFLSAWLNNRSANEGLCTQPCRWDYKVYPVKCPAQQDGFAKGKTYLTGVYLEEGSRLGEMIPIEADDQGTYIMNSRDLRLIDHLEKLKKAGVMSFKIEGRTKSIYYLGVVTRAYRQAIDGTVNIGELDKIDNRGYTTGFLFDEDEIPASVPPELRRGKQNFKTSKASSDWELVGEVTKVQSVKRKMQKIFVQAHNVLKSGDRVEIVTPGDIIKARIGQLFDKDNKPVKQVHGGTGKIFSFALKGDYDKIVEMSLLRKLK